MSRRELIFLGGIISLIIAIPIVGTGVLLADHADPFPTPVIPADEGAGVVTVTPGEYRWILPTGFPVPLVPADNPMSTRKVNLGRYLFYDVRLSGNQTMSCASCHIQALAFADGRQLPVGSTGMIHPRNSMSLTNIAYNANYTWANSLLTELESQIPIPMFGENPVEMGIVGSEEEVLNRFRENQDYQAWFAAAFPDDEDPVTYANIVKALASFTRTMISGNSPYDRYITGADPEALNESERRGMELFLSERLECVHCHTGFNFTLSAIHANTTFPERPFFNTGMYNLDGNGAYPMSNMGLIEVTNRPSDMGRFRPPTLRNIALTAPYMHDGSLATLDDVIDFYSAGGLVTETGEYVGDGRVNPYKSGFVAGFELTSQERQDLINFLMALTDETFITDPRFSNPFTDQ